MPAWWALRRRSERPRRLARRSEVSHEVRTTSAPEIGCRPTHDVVEAASTAEAAGYASLWTYERLLFPETPVEPYAGTKVPWPEASRQTADPLAVLTAAAVATEKVRLGTSLLVAALHPPVQLAKALPRSIRSAAAA